jgi:hypothetical protein
LVRPIRRGTLGLAALARQRGENLVEHAQTAPANEPIVDRLGRAVFSRRVAPAKPVPDDKHNRAHDPTVVNPSNPVRKRKIPLNPTHLSLRQQEQISHKAKPPRLAYESGIPGLCKKFNRS